MNVNFNIGDLVMHSGNGEFPAGTIGIVTEIIPKMIHLESKSPIGEGVRVYCQRASRWGMYETIVHKKYLTKLNEAS